MSWEDFQNRWYGRGIVIIFMLGMIVFLGQNLLDNAA